MVLIPEWKKRRTLALDLASKVFNPDIILGVK